MELSCARDILLTYIFYLTEIQSFWDIGEYSGIGLFLFRNIVDVLFALITITKSTLLQLIIIHEDSDMVIIFSIELNVFIRLIGVYINIISGWIDISFICTKICLRVIHSRSEALQCIFPTVMCYFFSSRNG